MIAWRCVQVYSRRSPLDDASTIAQEYPGVLRCIQVASQPPRPSLRKLVHRHSAAFVVGRLQRPGDVLVVPQGWAHGVLNLRSSVGWATPFEWHSSVG